MTKIEATRYARSYNKTPSDERRATIYSFTDGSYGVVLVDENGTKEIVAT